MDRYKMSLVCEVTDEPYIDEKVTSPSAVAKLLASNKSEEVFIVLFVNTKNEVLGYMEVSHGALDASMVHPREVFKGVLLANAKSIILVHNHPSGNPEPSSEDIAITERLVKCADLLGVKVLDHIIVSPKGNYYSFVEEGEMVFE